jgi:Arc/MetJ-type ribon-helix-helix transcriptional regulator
MKMVTVKIPDDYVDGLNSLVGDGMYPSRSAAIRVAVRDLLKEILWMANESTSLMDAPVTFKRWILTTCPECRKVVYVRRDWISRRCPHCRRKFPVNFDELLIIGTYNKLSDAQRHMSKPKSRSPGIGKNW